MKLIDDPLADYGQLDNIPLFHGLGPADLAVIAPLLTRVELPAGRLLLTRDQSQSDYLYIVVSGAVKVLIEQADGEVAVVAILGTHQIVGEMSHANGFGCSATVETIDRSVFFRLAGAGFSDLIHRLPALRDNLLRILSERLRIANHQILALVTLDATRRVATQIQTLAQAYGVQADGACHIPFRVTQSTLAAMTGLSRVQVNRIIQGLVEQHVIALRPQYHIAVLDDAALAACALSRPLLPRPPGIAPAPYRPQVAD